MNYLSTVQYSNYDFMDFMGFINVPSPEYPWNSTNDIFHISSLWYSMAGWKILELNPGANRWVVGESVSQGSEDVLKLNSNWTPGCFWGNHGDYMDVTIKSSDVMGFSWDLNGILSRTLRLTFLQSITWFAGKFPIHRSMIAPPLTCPCTSGISGGYDANDELKIGPLHPMHPLSLFSDI